MSLEFPGINSLQIQVTTKDFESWIHHWTILPYLLKWSEVGILTQEIVLFIAEASDKSEISC